MLYTVQNGGGAVALQLEAADATEALSSIKAVLSPSSDDHDDGLMLVIVVVARRNALFVLLPFGRCCCDRSIRSL